MKTHESIDNPARNNWFCTSDARSSAATAIAKALSPPPSEDGKFQALKKLV